MKYCSECNITYQDDVAECPKCHNPLVEKNALQEEDDLDLVPLHSLPGVIYGEMVKEALEKEGIRCVLQSDEMTSGLLAKGASAVGDVCYIYVERKHMKRAKSILHSMMDHI